MITSKDKQIIFDNSTAMTSSLTYISRSSDFFQSLFFDIILLEIIIIIPPISSSEASEEINQVANTIGGMTISVILNIVNFAPCHGI